MFRAFLSAAFVGFVLLANPSIAKDVITPAELAPMVAPLEEVEAMMADGTFKDGAFSLNVDPKAASTFASMIKQKLRTAKAEYTRMPRKIRSSKEADVQWYRMDALEKASKEFSEALQVHSRALKQIEADAMAAAAAKPKAETAASTTVPAAPTSTVSDDGGAAEAKRKSEARAAAIVAEREAKRAEAAAAEAAEKAAAAQRDDWRNSFIPNIKELQSDDGFFQWPWSQPSWSSVLKKAAEEQEKGRLSPQQIAMFKAFVLDQGSVWPAAPRIDDFGDVQYVVDMVRATEEKNGLDVVDVWISRSDWKIQRNSVGAILSRTKPGYMLYKDPSGESCILRQLWAKEPHSGGSNYERTSSWRYARIRFQSCDKR